MSSKCRRAFVEMSKTCQRHFIYSSTKFRRHVIEFSTTISTTIRQISVEISWTQRRNFVDISSKFRRNSPPLPQEPHVSRLPIDRRRGVLEYKVPPALHSQYTHDTPRNSVISAESSDAKKHTSSYTKLSSPQNH